MKMAALQILVKNMEIKELTEKDNLRKILLQKRRDIDSAYRLKADEKIAELVADLKCYQDAKRVFLYASTAEETDTRLIREHALAEDKSIYYPRVISKGIMDFYRVNSFDQEMEKGYMGIMEPVFKQGDSPETDADIIIIPGVGFDYEFNRLGYGGGFYDRYLLRLSNKAVRLAICYEAQRIKKMPAYPNDMKVDILITEKGIWKRENYSLNI